MADHPKLDAIAWRILEALQQDARISFAELGRMVGLSTPAAAERVRRLEDLGVITGYHAALDPAKLGVSMQVFVRLSIAGGVTTMNRVIAEVKQMREVIQCYRVTGEDSFILKADIFSIEHLESLINRLYRFGATSTMTVLSTPIIRRDYLMKNVEALIRESEK